MERPKIFVRLGIMVEIEPSELENLINESDEYKFVHLYRALHRTLDAEDTEYADTYIPADAVEQYNTENGTDFKCEDINIIL